VEGEIETMRVDAFDVRCNVRLHLNLLFINMQSLG